MSSGKLRLLFLCTHNACRSQMAEAWANALKAEHVEAHSAGTEATTIDPLAAHAMKEAGIDISQQVSKTVEELPGSGQRFDWVVIVCDGAAEACPILPGDARVLRRPFDDPPRLAAGAATLEEKLRHYRRIRDEIRRFVETLPESLVTDD